MRSLIYDGVEYRSIQVFCACKGISYQKMRRIVRHYKKANQDPTIAAKWLLEKHIPINEPKTLMYYHDIEQQRSRKTECEADLSEKIDGIFS